MKKPAPLPPARLLAMIKRLTQIARTTKDRDKRAKYLADARNLKIVLAMRRHREASERGTQTPKPDVVPQ